MRPHWPLPFLPGLFLIALSFVGCQDGGQEAAAPERPNILFVFSDDHAAHAISAYSDRLIQTPHLDRLAEEGMRFDNCFVTNSICTPSRATVLTGQYSHRNGAYTLDVDFDGSQQVFPKLLQEAGYYTAVIGKWHLGTQPTGFDYYQVLPGQGDYFDPEFRESTRPWSAEPKQYEGYVTDLITDFTLNTLKNRPKDKPFMVMYQHKAPHDNWEYDDKHAHLFAEEDVPEPANLHDTFENRGEAPRRATQRLDKGEALFVYFREERPEQLAELEEQLEGKSEHEQTEILFEILQKDMTAQERMSASYQAYIKSYLRCVASIDDNLGRVLEYLDEEGLTDNTLVIYTSDQGFFLGEHGFFDKRFMYEESLRMPFLVRYPKEIEAGSVNKDIVTNVDFAETFLDYAGVPIPDGMQGRSLRPLFRGNTPDDWRKSMYYRYYLHRPHYDVSAHYGVRTDRYKLIFYYGLGLGKKGSLDEPLPPEWELFDLEKDPMEMNNVYHDPAYAGLVKELKAELMRLKQELGDTDEEYPQLLEVQKEHW